MYQMRILHQKETANVEADTFSLCPRFQLFSLEELQHHQDNHPRGTYTTENGIVLVKKGAIRKVCVSYLFPEKLIQKAHQEYGHVRVKKNP